MQAHRRILATDEWLRVKGCENVYALGDCATIDQRKIMVRGVVKTPTFAGILGCVDILQPIDQIVVTWSSWQCCLRLLCVYDLFGVVNCNFRLLLRQGLIFQPVCRL